MSGLAIGCQRVPSDLKGVRKVIARERIERCSSMVPENQVNVLWSEGGKQKGRKHRKAWRGRCEIPVRTYNSTSILGST